MMLCYSRCVICVIVAIDVIFVTSYRVRIFLIVEMFLIFVMVEIL